MSHVAANLGHALPLQPLLKSTDVGIPNRPGKRALIRYFDALNCREGSYNQRGPKHLVESERLSDLWRLAEADQDVGEDRQYAAAIVGIVSPAETVCCTFAGLSAVMEPPFGRCVRRNSTSSVGGEGTVTSYLPIG